jgi:hypothetical protein
MLQDLMRIGDVEAGVRDRQLVCAADDEREVFESAVFLAGPGDRLRRRVDTDDGSRGNGCGEPAVMEPGPQPTSTMRLPGKRWGRRKAAASSAVLLL